MIRISAVYVVSLWFEHSTERNRCARDLGMERAIQFRRFRGRPRRQSVDQGYSGERRFLTPYVRKSDSRPPTAGDAVGSCELRLALQQRADAPVAIMRDSHPGCRRRFRGSGSLAKPIVGAVIQSPRSFNRVSHREIACALKRCARWDAKRAPHPGRRRGRAF